MDKLFVTVFISTFLMYKTESAVNTEEVIDETPMTIRVVTGSTASLPCNADPRYTEQYPDQYKVMWVSPVDTALSLQDRRIINDNRISVERPYLKAWNLHIRNVSVTDAGIYKCQINTSPVGTKKVTLTVQEPPSIIGHTLPSNIEKPEGERVDLFCNATGTPPPNITWYRLFRNTHGVRERVGQAGEALIIHNISRQCADFYECVADNDVPPPTNQVFKVDVLYSPEVHLPNRRLGQKIGKGTVLECEVSASPLSSVEWRHNGKKIKGSQSRELILYNNNPGEAVTLSLRILKVKSEDFGNYMCEATNALGKSSDVMELYEIHPRPRIKVKTTPAPSSTLDYQVWLGRSHSQDTLKHNTDNDAGSRGRINQQHGHNNHQSSFRVENDRGNDETRSRYTGVAGIDKSKHPENGAPNFQNNFTLHHVITAFNLIYFVFGIISR